jgi:PncC family amidohydrolase
MTLKHITMIAFDKSILESIGSYLLEKKESIAVAESVTAGLLQFAFSNIIDASKFFQGGITVYNLAQKFKHLEVEPIHAQSVNCVSEKVASEMALHVCRLFSSDWGIGVTGYATPVPESDNAVFAFFAIAYKNKVINSGKIVPPFADPPALQEKYVSEIILKTKAMM